MSCLSRSSTELRKPSTEKVSFLSGFAGFAETGYMVFADALTIEYLALSDLQEPN